MATTKRKNNGATVTIPSLVTMIDRYTYHADRSIKRIIIPESVTYIEATAFEYCWNLKEVYFDGTAAQWASMYFGVNHSIFRYGAKLYVKVQEATKGDVDYQDDGTLPGYEELTHVDLSGATRVRDFAFEDCQSVRSIDFASVKEIGVYAFHGCVNLAGKLDLKDVQTIKNGAFSKSQITEIIVPLSVTTLQGCPFSECNNVDVIKCRAKKRLKGWDKIWDYRLYDKYKYEVQWNYKDET